ncbi:hypothetical protein MKW94_027028 [Papaver nudicaule]|uniref:Uncharacterized protein n=1 Tax=Papaver nudicaule TaxID=74823 RepID=A0AA41S191_PAPNU|nr:hypothetical protein [Papaver nudicaule]
MALRNAGKLLSRRFANGGGGGIENRHNFIKDARLRSLCVQLEQATEEANQYREEFNAIFALKKAFPRDQVIWLGIIASINGAIAHQVAAIRRIKAQLAARLTEQQH